MAFGKFFFSGCGGQSRAGKIAPSCARVANHSAGFDSSCPLTELCSHIIRQHTKSLAVTEICQLRVGVGEGSYELPCRVDETAGPLKIMRSMGN